MFVTNHTLAGALLGARLPHRPATAFAAGAVSHLVMDALPHWGEEGDDQRWMRAARRDGLLALAVLGAVARAAPPDGRAGVLAGAAGAIAPDVRAPIEVAFGVQPFPAAFDRFHDRIQDGRERRRHLPVEAGVGALVAVALALRLRGLRRRAGGAPRSTVAPGRPDPAEGRSEGPAGTAEGRSEGSAGTAVTSPTTGG